MQQHGMGAATLARIGLTNLGNVYWNLSTPGLYEEAVRRGEAWISHLGPLIVRTGQHTGRSPNDKFIVREPSSEKNIAWGPVNQPLSEENFNTLHSKLCAYLQGRDIFVQNLYAGADPEYRIPVRVVNEYAWHNLFIRNLLIMPEAPVVHDSAETWTIIDSPRFHAIPEVDGTRSEVFIALHLARKLVIIGGTSYAGEIKKSVFTILNYLLPHRNVFPMHCSANTGKDGDVALFFGLSGTGKTTLSADPERALIGDDEHGWSEKGIFNFEGGCYAKVIRLSAEAEPEIFKVTRQFGTVLENVMMDFDSRRIDLNDESLTENTRAAYPLAQLKNVVHSGTGAHPKNLIMLTADAFGVLPPIARLTADQAMYQFLSGYTAKVAGTEKGVTEPKATFSTCFGAPFMPMAPTVYAKLLGERLEKYRVTAWLVNTGWTGGPYGTGTRMKIGYTRAMLHAALSGKLDNVETSTDPFFGLNVPVSCPNVPAEVLSPRATWKNKDAYDEKARDLTARFKKNFEQYSPSVTEQVRAAAPR
jgi:phosphoenolpyruvate carboxykinase (ATP)